MGEEAVAEITSFVDGLDRVVAVLTPIINNLMDGITAITDFVAALIVAEGDINATMTAIGEYFGRSAADIVNFWDDVITFFDEMPEKILGFFDGIEFSFEGIGEKIGNSIKSGF